MHFIIFRDANPDRSFAMAADGQMTRELTGLGSHS